MWGTEPKNRLSCLVLRGALGIAGRGTTAGASSSSNSQQAISQTGAAVFQPSRCVLQALLMAVWRRKPEQKVLIHSDQGSQFTSMDWAAFLKHHGLEHSMSRRGNCHDNAVAESFFNLLKRERIRRRTYKTRVEARQDVFDYIEMFYNPKRKHARNGMLSPVEFETQQKLKPEGV